MCRTLPQFIHATPPPGLVERHATVSGARRKTGNLPFGQKRFVETHMEPIRWALLMSCAQEAELPQPKP
jgi:hypothetical protein